MEYTYPNGRLVDVIFTLANNTITNVHRQTRDGQPVVTSTPGEGDADGEQAESGFIHGHDDHDHIF